VGARRSRCGVSSTGSDYQRDPVSGMDQISKRVQDSYHPKHTQRSLSQWTAGSVLEPF
jgi:hypothetical protein